MNMFIPIMTILAVAIFGIPEATAADCPCSRGWSEYSGNCYRYYANQVNWQEAQDRCVEVGANLVSIHSEAENAFAYALIITDSCTHPSGEAGFAWIGYNQPNPSTFSWSDGSPSDYENWASGQPDNYNHGYATEDCGHLRADPAGSWNDFPCNKLIGYICKKSV